MKDRQVVWSDDKVLRLVGEFVPVTVDTNVVRFAEGPGGEWFRKVADSGHFGSAGFAGGGSRGGGTQQGIYLATPDGVLLASGNRQDADYTADLMQSSLREFRGWKAQDGTPLPDKPSQEGAEKTAKASPPEGGLVLDVVLRQIYPRPLRTAPGSAELHLQDMERESLSGMEQMQLQRMERFASMKSEEYWHVPWNRDRAWFTSAEMGGFLPSRLEPGSREAVDPEIVDRIARLHCTDTVRAIADLYPEDSLKSADLVSTVVSREGDLVTLTLEGAFHLEQTGISLFERGSDRSAMVPKKPERSYQPRLLGRARYDLQSQQFTEFQLIAVGPKTGGSRLSPFDETQFVVAFQLIKDPQEKTTQEPRYLSYY